MNIGTTANTQPVLTYNSASVSTGGSTTVNPASLSDNGTITFTVQPGHGLTTAPTVDAGGVVSITNAQPAGAHTITIRAEDACGLMTNGQFTLNVGSSNTAPTANNDTFTTNEETPLSDNVLANDSDTEMDLLTATLVSGPSNAASFTLNSNGSFNYTPNADFNGMDSFT